MLMDLLTMIHFAPICLLSESLALLSPPVCPNDIYCVPCSCSMRILVCVARMHDCTQPNSTKSTTTDKTTALSKKSHTNQQTYQMKTLLQKFE